MDLRRKEKAIEPALHDWVQTLPFQMQALLMTAMRGPDTLPKYNAAKSIVRYLRGVVIRPAGGWSGLNDNDFMWGDYSVFHVWERQFFDDHDEYPHHFLMHLIHCAEVVGYMHPEANISAVWQKFYYHACESFHMNPEAKHELEERLNDFQ